MSEKIQYTKRQKTLGWREFKCKFHNSQLSLVAKLMGERVGHPASGATVSLCDQTLAHSYTSVQQNNKDTRGTNQAFRHLPGTF